MYIGFVAIMGALLAATALWLTSLLGRRKGSGSDQDAPAEIDRVTRRLTLDQRVPYLEPNGTTDSMPIAELQASLAIMCVTDCNMSEVASIAELKARLTLA